MSNFHDAPDAIAQHARFVHLLARSLVQDVHAAEDVAQDVLVTALERPPPKSWKLRAWLSGVAHNAARLASRRAERRLHRELAGARPEAISGTLDDAQRLELMRIVLDAVERLPSTYRTVVMLRFYDRLPPRRIASQLGIPVNTVRTRLRRALAQLRAEFLARRDSLGRDCLALLPLLITPYNAGVAASTISIGALVMSVKSQLAAAAVVLALLAASWGAWRWRLGSRATTATPRPVSITSERTPDRVETPVATIHEEPVDEDVAAAAPVPQRGGTIRLRGRLIAEPSVLARWSTRVLVTPQINARRGGGTYVVTSDDVAEERCEIDDHGRFHCEMDAPRPSRPPLLQLSVCGEDPRFRVFSRDVPVPTIQSNGACELDVDVHVFPVATIRGRTVDEDGKAIAHAGVALVDLEEEQPVGVRDDVRDESFTGEDGAFSLRATPKPSWLRRPQRCVVVATGSTVSAMAKANTRSIPEGARLLPTHVVVEFEGVADQEIGDLVLRRGATIRGNVRLPSFDVKQPIRIEARRPPYAESLFGRQITPLSMLDLNPRTVVIEADANNRFEIPGLLPGPWEIGFDTAGGARFDDFARKASSITVTAPCDDVDLEIGGAHVVVAVTEDGRPLSDAHIRFQRGKQQLIWGDFLVTDGDGRASALLAPGIEMTATANCSRPLQDGGIVVCSGVSNAFTTPKVGEEITVPIVITPRTPREVARLRIVSPDGTSIRRAGARLRPIHQREVSEKALIVMNLWSDDDVLRVRGIEPGRYQMTVRPDGSFSGGEGLFAEIVRDVEFDVDHVIELQLPAESAARLRVTARDAEGNGLPSRFQLRDSRDREVPIEIRHLEVGLVRGCGLPVEDLIPMEHRLAASMSYPLPEDEERRTLVLPGDDVGLIDPPLPPGHYEAIFSSRGFHDRTVALDLKGGECRFLEVVLDRD